MLNFAATYCNIKELSLCRLRNEVFNFPNKTKVKRFRHLVVSSSALVGQRQENCVALMGFKSKTFNDSFVILKHGPLSVMVSGRDSREMLEKLGCSN